MKRIEKNSIYDRIQTLALAGSMSIAVIVYMLVMFLVLLGPNHVGATELTRIQQVKKSAYIDGCKHAIFAWTQYKVFNAELVERCQYLANTVLDLDPVLVEAHIIEIKKKRGIK